MVENLEGLRKMLCTLLLMGMVAGDDSEPGQRKGTH
jgi:hypothetical protein